LSVQVCPTSILYGTYQKLATYGRVVSRPSKVCDTDGLGDVEELEYSMTLRELRSVKVRLERRVELDKLTSMSNVSGHPLY
jgi:hypothetical protein